MTRAFGPFAVLGLVGAAWGGTIPLSKIAVSQGYQHFGLIFWQLVITAMILGVIVAVRARGVPRGRLDLRLYLTIALIGTVLPNTASYQAVSHLPAGVISILLSLVPMFAFPIALAFGLERFRWRRAFGLTLGLAGVLVLIAPEASLPQQGQLWWVPVALIAPAFYALEASVVAIWSRPNLDAFQVLFGAALFGIVLALPLAVATGQFIDPRGPWGAPDRALIASAVLHAFAYTGYVWLVGRAGSVFTVQVSYLVTLFGVIWAITFLSESYSAYVWVTLALMLAGMALVQPRPRLDPLASGAASSDTVR